VKVQKFFLCQIKNFMGDAPGEIPHTPSKAKKSPLSKKEARANINNQNICYVFPSVSHFRH
jgi:hypothetical protein